MTELTVGDAVPDFELPATGDKTVSLSALRGRNVLLYFYPKANTPGCTQEGQDFCDLHEHFRAHDTVILGASRDGLKAQENFKAKHGFPFDLLSDKDETLCNLFSVIKDKNMYGKKVRGIERSTFLIDAEGRLRQVWRGVKVKGHALEALEAVKGLAQA